MAIAGVLDAAEGQVRFGADGRSVDVNDSALQLPLRDEGVVDVARIDGRGESVLHAIRDFEGLVETLERKHSHDGAEYFFLRDAHVRIAVGENSRLVEPAASPGAALQTMHPGRELRGFVFANLYVFH